MQKTLPPRLRRLRERALRLAVPGDHLMREDDRCSLSSVARGDLVLELFIIANASKKLKWDLLKRKHPLSVEGRIGATYCFYRFVRIQSPIQNKSLFINILNRHKYT